MPVGSGGAPSTSKTDIRRYRDADARVVGRLIADTFSEFNLSSTPAEERDLLLGLFRHARSLEKDHRAAIAQAIWSEMVFVAECDGVATAAVPCDARAAERHLDDVGRAQLATDQDLVLQAFHVDRKGALFDLGR